MKYAAALAIGASVVSMPSFAQPSSSQNQLALSDGMNGALALCVVQVFKQESLALAARQGMGKLPLTLTATVPDEVQKMTAVGAGSRPVFATLGLKEGKLWLVGATDRRTCQAVVGDSEHVPASRETFGLALSPAKGWKPVAAETSKAGSIWTQAWETVVPQASNVRVKVHLSGPSTALNAGQGPQVLMQVGLLLPKDQ